MRAADESNADRRADLEPKTVPEKRSTQHYHGLLQHARDPDRVSWSAQDKREFVATEPSDQTGIVKGSSQAQRDLAETCISGWMAERIVELLKTIKVDQDKGRCETMIKAVTNNLAIARLEDGAIGKPGERIGFRLFAKAFHCLPVVCDVLF